MPVVQVVAHAVPLAQGRLPAHAFAIGAQAAPPPAQLVAPDTCPIPVVGLLVQATPWHWVPAG